MSPLLCAFWETLIPPCSLLGLRVSGPLGNHIFQASVFAFVACVILAALPDTVSTAPLYKLSSLLCAFWETLPSRSVLGLRVPGPLGNHMFPASIRAFRACVIVAAWPPWLSHVPGVRSCILCLCDCGRFARHGLYTTS